MSIQPRYGATAACSHSLIAFGSVVGGEMEPFAAEQVDARDRRADELLDMLDDQVDAV